MLNTVSVMDNTNNVLGNPHHLQGSECVRARREQTAAYGTVNAMINC